MKILAFVSGAHPIHVAWFKSVGAVILPTLVSRRIHAGLNMALGAVMPKLVALMFALSKNCIKVLERPAIEVLARKSLLALGEGGGTLSHLKLVKKVNPNIATLLVSGDPIFYTLTVKKKMHRYKSMLRYVDYVVATSQYVRNLASKFIDPSKIKIVYPYPLHGCSPREAVAKKPSISRRKTILAYVGELSELKGFDILLEAFKILVNRYNSNAKLLIAGRGPLINLLSRYVKQYRGKIVYYGYTNPKPIYRIAHIYVHPARFDAFPVSVAEAITCGCIPVISKSTGTIDFLKNTTLEKLLILRKDDPEELAHVIADIISVKEDYLSQELEKVRKLIRYKTNMQRSIQEFIKTIRSIVYNIIG